MSQRKRISIWILGLVLVCLFQGCEEPGNLGRFRATPMTNIILDELGVVDEDPATFAGAREPLPRDLVPNESEYVIGPGDLLDISIYELFGPAQEWVGRKQVSEVGRITIPEIGTFRVAGKTELELMETIVNMLSPRIVKDPTVTVVVTGPRKKVFSISGAVMAPGPYALGESDYRLSRALAAAGGIPQANADYAYIIRTRGVQPGEMGLGELESRASEIDIWSPEGTPGAMEVLPSDLLSPGDLGPDIPPVREQPKIAPVEPIQTAPVKPKREQDELLESITPMSVVSPSPVGIQGGNFYGEVTINFGTPPGGTTANMNNQAAPGAAGPEQPAAAEQGTTDPDRSTVAPSDVGMGAATNGVYPSTPAATPPPPGAPRRSQSLSGWHLVRKGNRFELVPESGAAPLALELESAAPELRDDNIPEEPGRGDFRLPVGAPELGGMEVGWDEQEFAGPMQEVIQVDLKKLRGGDWTQNIVIRAGDDIQVPFNSTGIYSVMGQAARPGAYSLAGQRLTLKQAISTAGPLTALAWPSRCEIIRRIGDNKEVTYLVNLQKLFAGTAPDLFIKPNDIINVGSHPVQKWAAVIRNSFRYTYGFGFVYDRNFADKDFGH
jgi:protein involved in polysaccharide export with SLBB domain